MLEASGFDFRGRHPQQLLIKLAKHYGLTQHSAVVKTAYGISLDIYRTFAPLKQVTACLAFACLELAGRLHNEPTEPIEKGTDYRSWKVNRSMVMGMLSALSSHPSIINLLT
jgi:CTD kinase subunit beta